MLNTLGETQQELMKLLLRNKSGLTIDVMSSELQVTRTAVQQHLGNLTSLGYIERSAVNQTGGRPSQLYRLSNVGNEAFPKNYSWFSELLLESIRKQRGSQGLRTWLRRLGTTVGKSVQSEILKLKPQARIRELAKVMQSLNYEAKTFQSSGDDLPHMRANNCAYHALATKFPEVCAFDLALISESTGLAVTHTQCMLKGENCCSFKFEKMKSNQTADSSIRKSQKGERK
jgi:DeoR family suf operon transcriptional repressor